MAGIHDRRRLPLACAWCAETSENRLTGSTAYVCGSSCQRGLWDSLDPDVQRLVSGAHRDGRPPVILTDSLALDLATNAAAGWAPEMTPVYHPETGGYIGDRLRLEPQATGSARASPGQGSVSVVRTKDDFVFLGLYDGFDRSGARETRRTSGQTDPAVLARILADGEPSGGSAPLFNGEIQPFLEVLATLGLPGTGEDSFKDLTRQQETKLKARITRTFQAHDKAIMDRRKILDGKRVLLQDQSVIERTVPGPTGPSASVNLGVPTFGSTATVVAFDANLREDQDIRFMWLGDSRAVLVNREKNFLPDFPVHTFRDPGELDRVAGLGVSVDNFRPPRIPIEEFFRSPARVQMERVLGRPPVSRAFGAYQYKRVFQPVATGNPDTSGSPLTIAGGTLDPDASLADLQSYNPTGIVSAVPGIERVRFPKTGDWFGLAIGNAAFWSSVEMPAVRAAFEFVASSTVKEPTSTRFLVELLVVVIARRVSRTDENELTDGPGDEKPPDILKIRKDVEVIRATLGRRDFEEVVKTATRRHIETSANTLLSGPVGGFTLAGARLQVARELAGPGILVVTALGKRQKNRLARIFG